MDAKQVELEEFGLKIARERVLKKIKRLLNNKDKKEFKKEIVELILEKEKIEKGNIKIIKKYLGEDE